MRHPIGVGCAAAATALTLLLTATLPGRAEPSPTGRPYELRTRIVEQPAGVGESDGSLQLRVSPAGIVSGYYRADDNARFVTVSGGVTGNRFWIDIGALAAQPLHFSGTFREGTIVAHGDQPFWVQDRYSTLELLAKPTSGSSGSRL